jgi:hypothetical protein
MVVKSYAVAYPRAMVVHPHDTSIADGAVVTARRPHRIALHAVAPVNHTTHLIESVNHFVFD